MPVLRFNFVGGPFDGAFMDVDIDSYVPRCWFLRECDPDDMLDSLALRFGLLANLLPCVRSERYILSARDSTSATYMHESVKTGGPAKRQERVA